ncbi:unnamed protein product, partial [Prorocentrum cordatum]
EMIGEMAQPKDDPQRAMVDRIAEAGGVEGGVSSSLERLASQAVCDGRRGVSEATGTF